jgi:tRNA(Ile)-lysidine synthase
LPVVVAHFQHGLRPEAAADAEWVSQLAAASGASFELGRPEGEAPGTGIEAWARGERYRFLERVAATHGARWVAVGHTADDQAETVLHHILRGTGLAGLRGIPATRKLADGISIIRPSLTVRREALRTYLSEIGQAFRHDATNDESRWTRNSLRNELIPQLQSRYNPRLCDALLSLSQQASEAYRVIRQKAARLLKRSLLEVSPERVRIQAACFVGTDLAILREAAVLLWKRQSWPRQRMGAAHWQAAAELLSGRRNGTVTWPQGIVGTRRKSLVAIERVIKG